MYYKKTFPLDGEIGNNILSYKKRWDILGKKPELTIPSIIKGNIDCVKIGNQVVFEEIEDGELKSCIGLENFVRLIDERIPTTVFDNHNHALYFWIEAIHESYLKPEFELIHIDEHSDLWPNSNILDKDRALSDLGYAWEFTNYSCNVGNYIEPALNSGLITNMIRIENEFQVDEYMEYIPRENSVLNIDLDFFAPEMDFIDAEKKIRLIKNLLPRVQCITIATSPFFIDQKRSIQALSKIYSN